MTNLSCSYSIVSFDTKKMKNVTLSFSDPAIANIAVRYLESKGIKPNEVTHGVMMILSPSHAESFIEDILNAD